MERIVYQLAAVVSLAVLLIGCSTHGDLAMTGLSVQEQRAVSVSKAVASGTRVWNLVSAQPLTYVPAGYEGPVAEGAGELIEDERFRRAYFVPRSGVGGWTAGDLRTDAIRRLKDHPDYANPDFSRF